MRKILALALCLLTMLVSLAARAEAAPETALAWLPAGATYLGEEPVGSGRALSYQTDENAWTLTLDGAGNALSLQSAGVAAGGLQTRAEAEAALWALDEAALILRAEEGDGPARLYFVATGAAGWAQFDIAGGFAAGAVAFGQFLSNGQLTFAGASQVLQILRPGAQLDGMDMDEDDGMLLYEGDAYLDGQEYEFELDARTGRLLEWERD